MKTTRFFVLYFLSILSIHTFAGNNNYRIAGKIHLSGNGGWDYLTVDNVNSHLFVSHGTEVIVVNLKNNEQVGVIPDTKGVHGIAIATFMDKGFISDGLDTAVTVFDLKTLKTIRRIKVTGKNPDAILYEPSTQRIFTFNGRSSNSTVIDASTEKVIGTIPLPGKPEFAVTDSKGVIYVNIENKNLICRIDAAGMKVVKSWSIAPGESPSGLAYDANENRLFSVCDNKLMVVSNPATGKVTATLPIGEEVDGAAFDPVLKRIYSSNGDGTLTVVQQKSADKYQVLENFPTQKGARTIALDPVTHKLYLPTAGFEPAPAGQHKRPAIIPGTFTVLEVSEK